MTLRKKSENVRKNLARTK